LQARSRADRNRAVGALRPTAFQRADAHHVGTRAPQRPS